MKNSEPIDKVRSVAVRVLKPIPAQILVFADGIAASAGWHDGRLIPSDEPSTEDTVKLSFVATPPQLPDAQVLTPLRAAPYAIPFSETIRVIEVISATNRVLVELSQAPDFDSTEALNRAMMKDFGAEQSRTDDVEFLLANQFELANDTTTVSFTNATLSGEPQLHYNGREFSGRQVTVTQTLLGLLVQVVLEFVADGDTTLFTLIVPPVRLTDPGDKAPVELLGLTTVNRTTFAGPPPGQNIIYSNESLNGQASFAVSEQ